MNSLVKEITRGLLYEEKQRTVALYAGGFKPPTSGHFEVVQQALKENPEIDEMILYIGNKERNGISQDESLLIWEIYNNYLPFKVTIEPTSTPPIKAVYNYAKEHPNEEVLWIIGAREGVEQDFKDISSRTTSISKYPNLELRTIITKGGVSGTAARNAAKVSFEKFTQFIPDILSDEEKQEIYQIVSDKIQENASYSNHIDYKQRIKELTKHMLNKGMNIIPLPKVRFIHSDSSNAKDFFGKTAYYDPNNQEIVLYTEGRHPKDIVRSFSHEMIHHIQFLEGRLGDIQTTNTQEDDSLNDIEAEANLKGTMTFRNWTDSLNENILPQEKFAQETGKDYVKDALKNIPQRDKYNIENYKIATLPLDKVKPTQFGEDYINASSEYEAEQYKKYLKGEIGTEDLRKEDFYPIIVDKDTMEIIDGNHRHAVHTMLGIPKIKTILVSKKLNEETLIEKEDQLMAEVVNPDGERFEYEESNIEGLFTYKDSYNNLYFARIFYQQTSTPHFEFKVGWFEDNNLSKPKYEPQLPPNVTGMDNLKRRNTIVKIYRDEILPYFKSKSSTSNILIILPISDLRYTFSKRLVQNYTPKQFEVQYDDKNQKYIKIIFKDVEEAKSKDPFGLNAYAMELARLREDEDIKKSPFSKTIEEYILSDIKEYGGILEFKIDLTDTYQYTSDSNFWEFYDDINNVKIIAQLKSTIKNISEFKFYSLQDGKHLSFNRLKHYNPRVMNTIFKIFLDEVLPNNSKILIQPFDYLRYRLFRAMLNNNLNGNEYKIDTKDDPMGQSVLLIQKFNSIKEETDIKKPWKIYLDMDGVLADFDQRFKDLSGMAPREYEAKYGKTAFWDFIDEGDNKIKFWVGIPVMFGAKQLVDFAQDYDYELLTAPSLKKQSLIGKTVWVKKHTGDLFRSKPKINFKAAKNKHKIKPNLSKYDILVDDRASTIDNWNNAGGTGILYTSSNQAINDLKKLGL